MEIPFYLTNKIYKNQNNELMFFKNDYHASSFFDGQPSGFKFNGLDVKFNEALAEPSGLIDVPTNKVAADIIKSRSALPLDGNKGAYGTYN